MPLQRRNTCFHGHGLLHVTTLAMLTVSWWLEQSLFQEWSQSCSLLSLNRVNWAKSAHVLDVIVFSSTNSVSKNGSRVVTNAAEFALIHQCDHSVVPGTASWSTTSPGDPLENRHSGPGTPYLLNQRLWSPGNCVLINLYMTRRHTRAGEMVLCWN